VKISDAEVSKESNEFEKNTFTFELFEKNPYLCIYRTEFLAIFKGNKKLVTRIPFSFSPFFSLRLHLNTAKRNIPKKASLGI